MTKRRLVWVGVVLCVALLTCAAAGWLTRPHPVNRANFERIQVGMTQAEVEATFGCPPGDYSMAEPEFVYCSFAVGDRLVMRNVGDSTFLFSPGKPPEEGTLWASDGVTVAVWFDAEGRVRYASFSELLPEKRPNLIDRLRAWLGW